MDTETSETQDTGWRGTLDLDFQWLRQGSVLTRNRHQGPLLLQRPLYPEGKEVCHGCILHPPGGVVGGDSLELRVNVQQNSHALLTTPGATKFYRSSGPLATQTQHLHVAKDACLEWLPQDSIIFPGARASLSTRINLEEGARFMGWEILCLGLPVNNDQFTTGHLQSRLSLYRNGKPLFLDRLHCGKEEDLQRITGLRGYAVTASFIVSHGDEKMLEEIRKCILREDDALLGCTLLHGDLLLMRYLGNSTFAAHGLFAEIWAMLRPEIMGRTPCVPRIWAT